MAPREENESGNYLVRRFMRREWKRNKPYLQKSDSLPTLSLLPEHSRPHLTCRRCGFTNTQIPMCLWCCWTSEDAETEFAESMPRARRVSAPMRIGVRRESSKKGKIHGNRRSSTRQHGSSPEIEPVIRRWESDEYKGDDSGPAVGQIKAWDFNRLRIRGDPRGKGSRTKGDMAMSTLGADATNGPNHSRLGLAVASAKLDAALRRCKSKRMEVSSGGQAVTTREANTNEVQSDPHSKFSPITQPTIMTTTSTDVFTESYATTMPTTPTKERTLLSLRLRRLKGVAPPLHINSQAQIHAPRATSASASSPELPAMTTLISKSPSTPRLFQQVSKLNLRQSRSKRSNHESDTVDDGEETESSMTPRNSSQRSGSTPLTPTRPQIAITTSRLTTRHRSATTLDMRRNYPYPMTPPSPRTPWSGSDPFGDLLALQETTPSPTTPSMVRTPVTQAEFLTRPRAATTSAINPPSPYLTSPTSPALSVRSGHSYSSYPKPLYSAIRKNGICLTPLASPSLSTFASASSERLDGEGTHGLRNVGACSSPYSTPQTSPYHSPHISPKPPPTSTPPKPILPLGSPVSSLFPLYPPSGDGQLPTLTIDSRPSSIATSSQTECAGGDGGGGISSFNPFSILKAGCGCGSKFGPRSRPQYNTQMRPTSGGSTKPGVGGASMGVMEVMGVGTKTTSSLQQKVFQVPLGIVPGAGYSMSGEAELKLALARVTGGSHGGGGGGGNNGISETHEVKLVPQRKVMTTPTESFSPFWDKELPAIPTESEQGARSRSGSSGSLRIKSGEVVRKIKEMVAKTF